MKISAKNKNLVFDYIVYVYLLGVGLITLYPFWFVLVLSLNDALDTMRGGVYFIPRMFSVASFEAVLKVKELPIAFMNSILRTSIGTTLTLTATSMLAFTLSRREFIFRGFVQKFIVITMYVNGGLIPYYFVIKGLGLRNNFLVYILPYLLSAYYVIIVRSYMDGLPVSLYESAKLDGANDFQMFYKIAIPLSKPVLAAISLFIAVDQWNMWFDSFIFTSKVSLTTMQFELVKILSASTANITNIDQIRANLASGGTIVTTPESIRMAITIVATLPILLVYPFIQKYFVKGITIGAVKG